MGSSSKFLLFFLHLLFLGYALADGHQPEESKHILRLHSLGDTVEVHPTSSHGRHDHMESAMVFFTLNDLKIGNKLPFYFPKHYPKHPPNWLPKNKANSIPFSFPKGSPQAKAMSATLSHCHAKPMNGEKKICATSSESMLGFVNEIFGELDFKSRVLTTTHFIKSSVSRLENYTILEEAKEIPAPVMVACHPLPYPYTVFYCHNQSSETKVLVVSLAGDGGDRVEAVAACHMDTSGWSRDHLSFRVLGIEPGSSHVCHFFADDNLVYVPMSV